MVRGGASRTCIQLSMNYMYMYSTIPYSILVYTQYKYGRTGVNQSFLSTKLTNLVCPACLYVCYVCFQVSRFQLLCIVVSCLVLSEIPYGSTASHRQLTQSSPTDRTVHVSKA